MKILKKAIFYSFVIGMLFSCKMKQKVQDSDVITTAPLTKGISNTMVYFKGIGTEPFWAVEISKEQIKFTSLTDIKEFIIPYVTPIRTMDANIKSYRSETESGNIIITIQQQKCSDHMSDKEYDYKVNVTIQRKADKKPMLFEGCGTYILDYRLHDIWILESIEGTKVGATDFQRKIPNIEIDTQKAKFIGFAGCNTIRGDLFSEDSLLRFKNVISTMMACPSAEKEMIFLKALQSATAYDVKNNKLYLSNPDGEKIVFRKTD